MLEKNLKKTKKRSSDLLACLMLLIASSALLSLIACSEKAQESSSIPSKAKKEISKTAAEKEIKNKVMDQKTTDTKDSYTYNPNGKVDPFVPLLSEAPESEYKQKTESKPSEKDIPMTPLQKLDVDDFNLVAVIATPTGFCALLEDPAMNGYKVKEGMQIGRKSGIIKKILHNSVIIEENKEIDQKNIEKKINTLTLRKK